MGFTPPRKHYRLKFQDEDLAGLEVVMSSTTIADLMKLQRFDAKNPGPDDMATVLAVLAGSLMSWNVENEMGAPVPPTVESLGMQEPGFIMSVMSAWTEAITGVMPPLPGNSLSGEKFQEVSLPMEVPSPNPGS